MKFHSAASVAKGSLKVKESHAQARWRADHAAHFGDVPVNSASRHVNLITANGSVRGDKSVCLDVPEFGGRLECYLLDSTPLVFSVDRRCMEDGFEFHWFPKKASYFISPEGKKLRRRMRGMVLVIGSDSLVALVS